MSTTKLYVNQVWWKKKPFLPSSLVDIKTPNGSDCAEYFHKFLILGDPQFGQYKDSVNSARSKGKSKFFGMMSAAAKSVAKRYIVVSERSL